MRSLRLALLLLAAAGIAEARVLQFVEVDRNGVGAVQGMNGPAGLALSADGASLYVAASASDAIAVFHRDAASQGLAFVEAQVDGANGVQGLAGARAVAVSPDGRNVYATGYVGDALVTFVRDTTTGALTFAHVLHDGVAKVNGLDGGRALAVSPDGAHVYVGGGAEDAIALFHRDPATGKLAFVDAVRNGGAVSGLGGVRALALSPDGATLYAAGERDDSLVAFARDAATGALAFVQAVTDGVDGVNGINGASGVAVAPDGRRVYATGIVDNALAVFRRDPATGRLAFDEMIRDGVDGADGLHNASGVEVSADGHGIYALGHFDDAIAVFRPGCGNGVLDPGEECDDGNDVDGDCCSSTCRFEHAGSTCADDGNGCTDDVCDGAGACTHPNNTAPCDDGLFCTVGDVCKDGVCGGTTRDCAAVRNDCNDAVCDENANACVPVPKADGTSCSDGSACTRTDACVAGRCVGGDPVVCAPGDQCRQDGVCDPATGVCTNAPRPDGTSCDDGDACTRRDACVAGSCRGADPVRCEADACHEAGTCDPATGLCSGATRPDGTACDDGNVCTAGDVCRAGTCTGVALPDRDHDGICDAADDCPDFADPEQRDADHDGVGDRCECTDTAPGHCIPGGGDARSDCLVEWNPTGPVVLTPNKHGVRAVLRCVDGDPSCDRDGTVDGKCTFGIALCLANADPRLHGCRPSDVRSLQLLGPSFDAGASTLARTNTLAVVRALGTLGLSAKGDGLVVAADDTSAIAAPCSAPAELVVPAPAGAKGVVRKTFRLRAEAADGRRDADRVTLECR